MANSRTLRRRGPIGQNAEETPAPKKKKSVVFPVVLTGLILYGVFGVLWIDSPARRFR